LSQPKVLNPKHFPHLSSQSLRPLKLIKVVSNHGGTTSDPFVEGINLLSEVLDVLNLLSAQVFKREDLFVQPFELSLATRSPSYQVLSEVVVAPRSRAGVHAGPGNAIHDLFDLRHRRHVQMGGFDELNIEARTETSSDELPFPPLCLWCLKDIDKTSSSGIPRTAEATLLLSGATGSKEKEMTLW
jgi:hypothetical protein